MKAVEEREERKPEQQRAQLSAHKRKGRCKQPNGDEGVTKEERDLFVAKGLEELVFRE
jgi:hypothetical protein